MQATVISGTAAKQSSAENALTFNRLTPGEVERNERIEKNYSLVDTVLTKLRRNLPSHVNADDLHGVGVAGLVSAAERYAPERSNSFPGYAYIRIRGAMLDELRRMDPCSRRSRQLAKKIEGGTQEAAQSLGRPPTDQELSARFSISLPELLRWREAATPVRIVSLDVSPEPGDSRGDMLHEMIADDEQECAYEGIEREELLQLLTDCLSELPDVQKKTLAMYYYEGMRFGEIASAFGLTESRICQIHKQAVAKLRALLRAQSFA